MLVHVVGGRGKGNSSHVVFLKLFRSWTCQSFTFLPNVFSYLIIHLSLLLVEGRWLLSVKKKASGRELGSKEEIAETERVYKCNNTAQKQLPSHWVEINTNIKELPLANFIWRAQPSMCDGINFKVQMIQKILGKMGQSIQLTFKFISHTWITIQFKWKQRSAAHLQICPRNVWCGFRKHNFFLWLNWFAWSALTEVLSCFNFTATDQIDIKSSNTEFTEDSTAPEPWC